MNEFDVLVVGGGAAGLTAALVLLRARRTVAVIDAGSPRNAPAAEMHGFLSRDGMPPAELIAAGRAEVAGYGGTLIDDTVTSLEPGFRARLASGVEFRARRILVATGLRDEVPDVPGVRERWGRDVLHCPYCHGYEVRDQPLGVLGGSAEAVQHALLIRQWSADVVLFEHTDTLDADQRELLAARAVRVIEGRVARLTVENDRLHGVELADGTVLTRSAVFVRPRFVPNSSLLSELGCAADENGWVTSDTTGRTTVPGVRVAGNAADPRAQVITAAGQGSAAAIAIHAELVEDDVRDALTAHRTAR
ncbi:NAD(P)/FAD-dependent oxidoreductase [Lysobacter korlensis]|uniref:NAD(P)/FAD-dependent oxidoreductase n=1 Tax=Lysobacter korlensis TaxID=553636 RepID=A0ABV6S0L2_9GAMM